MKNVITVGFIWMVLAMSSCATSSFDKQKFISVGKLDNTSSTTELSPVKPDVSAADRNQDGGPNEDLIKMGIENNTLFILHQDNGYYRCNDLEYDGVYKTISTRLEKIELSDFQELERIELEVKKGIEYNAVVSKIDLIDLESSTYVKGEKTAIETSEEPKTNVNCKDIIYLKNGDSLMVKIDYTSKENVYYYSCSEDEKTVHVKSKSEITNLYFQDESDNFLMKSDNFVPADHITKDESTCGDLMILKSGTEIPVRIIEIRDTEIEYKKCNDKMNRTFVKKLDYISSIKFADGHEYEIKPNKLKTKQRNKEKKRQQKIALMIILGLLLIPILYLGIVLIVFAFF